MEFPGFLENTFVPERKFLQRWIDLLVSADIRT
jgi:hypothetical protein